MTVKRYKYNGNYFQGVIFDNRSPMSPNEIVDLLNDLSEENEQLKQAYTQLKHRHSLLHDVCIDAECDRDSYCKDIASLKKENEQLKQQMQTILKLTKKIEDCTYDIKVIGDVE